jgi:hypothetical protein
MVEPGTEKHEKKWARNPKRKECGTMEENGRTFSSIDLYKAEPMIRSAGTAKTQRFGEWGKVSGSPAALCRNSRGTQSMPWQSQQATAKKQAESKTVNTYLYLPITFSSLSLSLLLPSNFQPPCPPNTHTHTHTHMSVTHF